MKRTPIRPPRRGTILEGCNDAHDPIWDKDMERFQSDLVEQMAMLADQYEIAKGEARWFILALRLAIKHKEITISSKQPGRRTEKWGYGQRVALLIRVERARASGCRDLASAVRKLTKAGASYAGEKSLRRRIEEARKNDGVQRLVGGILKYSSDEEIDAVIPLFDGSRA